MNIVAFIQVFLAIIFLISAIAKLFSLKSFQHTLHNLGFSFKNQKLFSWFIPSLELIISMLIFIESTRFIAGIVVILLLVAFSAAVVKAILTGEKVNCNCFGSLTNDTIGWKTIVHILLILVLDVCLITTPEVSNLYVAPLEEIFSSIVLSIGIFITYALGSSLFDFYQASKLMKH
ncbi:MauE/DoxX family redox-associated membrane protein [Bacillus toyonensis]|uniref:MauE/DoxX family redox-associated membrane protein n=1 Tax=Bacillus toyonensis TaxID=155322 RepID=UPI00159666D7|nr:MauE/DoxX family redox-associated membrane protein [Bacillus toyonensis]